MLLLDRASHAYGDTIALHEVSLIVGEGEFVAISGPSGSGKTTMLHIFGGLLAPISGTCAVNGQNMYAMTDRLRTKFRQRVIGLIFQRFNLIPYLSARENIEMSFYLQGMSHLAQVGRANALLEQLNLLERASHFPAELSVGEQQRVAVARAIAAQAPVLLADEPTGNLDPFSSKAVLDLIEQERKKRGLTVVMVTHQPEVAKRAERSIELSGGETSESVRTHRSLADRIESRSRRIAKCNLGIPRLL